MHRSSSSARVSGDLSDHPPPSSQNYTATSDDSSEVLPTYDPQSYVATKQQNQIRSAEAAIHLIPVLLVICAMILWFFSDTDLGMAGCRLENAWTQRKDIALKNLRSLLKVRDAIRAICKKFIPVAIY